MIISSILKFQSKKKNERQKLKNSDRKFMSQIDNLKKNVEEKDARLAEFEETGLKDKEKIEELKKENKEVLDEMKKNLNEEGAKNLEKMSGELQKSQNENLELHNSIVDLKTEIRDQKEANKDLTDKIGNLKEEIEHKVTTHILTHRALLSAISASNYPPARKRPNPSKKRSRNSKRNCSSRR